MPRKPKPGPSILRIETLSDGQVHPLHLAVDDFTGQPIKPNLGPSQPIKPIPDGPELTLVRQRKQAADSLMLLKVVGIVPDDRPKRIRPPFKPFVRRV